LSSSGKRKASPPTRENKEEKLEIIISYILRIGLITSVVIISVGLLIYYISTGTSSPHFSPKWQMIGSDFFTYVRDLLLQIFRPSIVSNNNITLSNYYYLSIRLMAVGVIVLMITPLVRVIVSLIFFGLTKDVKYIMITSFVLIVLTLSLITH
jgi:uncharacterized membrane protein